jgi:protein arginine N-methyltransferase 1
MYSVFEYGQMIADKGRVSAYAQALRQAIKPGCVVLDIGTGTGILALLASRLGARRVYAIEPNDAVVLAREVATANGYARSIEFIQELSTKVSLPEKADVIVSDLRGILPLFAGNVPAIVDARKRFLAPGGILIPQQDELWAAVVHAPDLHDSHVRPWEHNAFDFDLRAALRLATNTWRKGRVNRDQLLVEPQLWARVDYSLAERAEAAAELTWTVARAGMAHGLVVWFDATLADGVRLSNAPGEPELIYGSAFFPWPAAVALAAGDTVTVALEARQVGQDCVWRWDCRVLKSGDAKQIRARFQQSDFFAQPRSAARLRKQAAGYVPSLNDGGLITQFILAQIDGKTSLGDIATRVSHRFSECFATWHAALTRVAEEVDRAEGNR